MIPSAVYVNDKVVMYYKQPAPKYIKVGGAEVVFSCEHGVSLAFVEEDKVQPLLDHKGGCCNKQQQIFTLASETQYKHFLDGQGGR